MESNMHNLKPVTKTVLPHVNKGRRASSTLRAKIQVIFAMDSLLQHSQLLFSVTPPFKVLRYIFRTSA